MSVAFDESASPVQLHPRPRSGHSNLCLTLVLLFSSLKAFTWSAMCDLIEFASNDAEQPSFRRASRAGNGQANGREASYLRLIPKRSRMYFVES